MGSLVAGQPLAREVQRVAVLSAHADPRFTPVTADELERLTIEITVLGPLEPVTDIDSIVVGEHGLYLVCGPRRGTLLPQVASARGWTCDEYLSQLCLKAGVAEGAWRKGQLFKFAAQSIAEETELP
jgi:AmmeMemoRadiSam system protein A